MLKIITKDSHCFYCDSKKFLQTYKGVLTCCKHRTQLVRHGKLLGRTKCDANEITKLNSYCQMSLYNRKGEKIAFTFFDIADLDRIKKYRWTLDKDNYVFSTINGKRVALHRFILNYYGKEDIDHKNKDRLDNRRENIRIATRSQNLENRDSKGVSIDKRYKYKKFRAYITSNRKRIELGLFETEEEALKVRHEAELKYFGEFAPIREPKIALDEFRRLF